MASSSALIALLVVVGCATAASATTFAVGDAQGWRTNVDYSSWANAQSFAVGDKLAFNFGSGHTVTEVSKSDYDNCGVSGNPISDATSGPATIDLTAAGARYFICNVPSHCASGMKLAVTVAAAGGGSSSGTTTTPPSTGTTTTTPSPSRPTGGASTTRGQAAAAVVTAAAAALVKLALF
ncbi:hypothetical protein GUJ93_ZPchr0010g7502 [Zizania palustris]|uniref:Phytocyanin domain-containing protein n=1 Tax=Zizania palustris TaxID=103762 RepID=A0A8J5WEU4_ZIZPA|nr:hypothetical protein GUJ93_ZPchr0010g7502 [Zizania palustris]KAG8087348.1 hypothetical protein GUJ93_ZPchr0010g7502 [Zizania palustris]